MHLITTFGVKLSFIAILSMLLSACGFHLRGDYDVPKQLTHLSVTSYDQYSTFTRMMKKELRMNKITIEQPTADIPNLHLLSETSAERTLSIYQNTRAAEIAMTLTVNYQITIPDVGNKTLTTSVTRSYLDNPLTALAKSVEKSMIIDEMRQLAASQIIRQMARLKSDFKTVKNQTLSDDANNAVITTTVEK
jgi:LPS-assembly lipoprotein